MSYESNALFGENDGYSAIPANMLNAGADGAVDWGYVVSQGIKGAAQNAIGAMVNGAYADGQLQQNRTVQVTADKNTMNLLIIGALVFFVLAGSKK